MSSIETNDNSQTFLVSTFYIGDTFCGLDTMRVQEVVRLSDVTLVHQSPEYIVGIINLRGKIVTIIDLGKKLDLDITTITDECRIFIMEWKNEYVGLLVDRAADVIPADRSALTPPPANVKGVQGKFFEGVYQSQEHLIAILNVEEVLNDDSTSAGIE